MTDTKKLKEKIQASGLKKSYIAFKLGVSPSTVTALLQNKTEFKASQIRAICEVLNIQDDAEIRSIFFGNNGA